MSWNNENSFNKSQREYIMEQRRSLSDRNNNARMERYQTPVRSNSHRQSGLHTSTVTSTQRRRHGSTSSTASDVYDDNGMLLRSGSRLHTGVSSVIDSETKSSKTVSEMENYARRQRMLGKTLSTHSPYSNHNHNSLRQSYNNHHNTLTTVKTVQEEYSEYTTSTPLYGGSRTSTPPPIQWGTPARSSNNNRLKEEYSKSSAVQHLYGLDHDQSFSDEKNSYGSYSSEETSDKEHIDEFYWWSKEDTWYSVLARTVTTLVYYPLWWLWSGLWAGTVWAANTTKHLLYEESREESVAKRRKKKVAGGCCCCLILLPLLLLFAIPALLGLLAAKEEDVFIPPCFESDRIPVQKPSHLNIDIQNLRATLQEEMQAFKLDLNAKHDHFMRTNQLVKEMIQKEIQAVKLGNVEHNHFIRMSAAKCNRGGGVNYKYMDDKFDQLMALHKQMSEEITNVRNVAQVEFAHQQDRLEDLESKLIALTGTVNQLDAQFLLLSANLTNKEDFTTINVAVNQILNQMMNNYESSEGSQSGFMAWIKDNFISQDEFRARLKELAEDLALKMTNTYNMPSYTGEFNSTYVQEMIDGALWKFYSDKTGQVDYALESAGGSIISTRCSETYNSYSAVVSIFGIPLWYQTPSARMVISPEMNPGNCWPFKGNQGSVVVRLSVPIVPTAFSIEHIPKSVAPLGHIKSAPSDFTVLGLQDETDSVGVTLGIYRFAEDGPPLQYFPVKMTNPGPFEFVELRVLDNHGNKEYTCIYRFRVHGHNAESS